MLILIAGPYRSGTGDDPDKMAANLRRLEEVSWPLFRAGHVPMIGEWVALPIWRVAGGSKVGDPLYDEILHPTAGRLIRNGAARSCTDRAPPVSSSRRARRTGLAMASNTSGPGMAGLSHRPAGRPPWPAG